MTGDIVYVRWATDAPTGKYERFVGEFDDHGEMGEWQPIDASDIRILFANRRIVHFKERGTIL